MQGTIHIGKVLCAQSIGTFALLNPDAAKRMGFVDDEVIRGMAPLLDVSGGDE
jgi:hypothetical protein